MCVKRGRHHAFKMRQRLLALQILYNISFGFVLQVGLQTIEVKTQLTHRDYTNLLSQENPSHFPVFKTRRCFMHKNQYFQLDIYREPSHRRCKVKGKLFTTCFNENPPEIGVILKIRFLQFNVLHFSNSCDALKSISGPNILLI